LESFALIVLGVLVVAAIWLVVIVNLYTLPVAFCIQRDPAGAG
jgi:uncharacterized protein YhhL (DUF1145 family)